MNLLTSTIGLRMWSFRKQNNISLCLLIGCKAVSCLHPYIQSFQNFPALTPSNMFLLWIPGGENVVTNFVVQTKEGEYKDNATLKDKDGIFHATFISSCCVNFQFLNGGS